MQTYSTVNDIKTEMEALYRNITGREYLSAIECDIVYSSIVDAYQFVLLEYGVDTFKFQEQAITSDTTAGTNYIDLDEYIYKVVGNSVRIADKEVVLGLIDEKALFQTDPGLEQTGVPTHYAYINSTDPNVVRLRLWPTPDAVYTISMNVLKYPSDDIDEFPTYLMSAVKNKAKALSCLGLGMFAHIPGFNSVYEDIMAKIKDGYNNDGPRHIGRSYTPVRFRSVEGRIP